MKFAFTLTVLFIACSMLLSAEVSVLPAGTVIIEPQGASITLPEAHFLLSRLDMEGVVLCKEEVLLLRTDNQQLSSENQKLEKKTKGLKIALVAVPISTSLLAFLISYLLLRAAQ